MEFMVLKKFSWHLFYYNLKTTKYLLCNSLIFMFCTFTVAVTTSARRKLLYRLHLQSVPVLGPILLTCSVARRLSEGDDSADI